jgi:hypothetical protein
VAFTPTIQYLPLHLSGIIHCHIESNPPYQFITWTKDKRIFDPFDHEGMQSLTNGSLFITKVRQISGVLISVQPIPPKNLYIYIYFIACPRFHIFPFSSRSSYFSSWVTSAVFPGRGDGYFPIYTLGSWSERVQRIGQSTE